MAEDHSTSAEAPGEDVGARASRTHLGVTGLQFAVVAGFAVALSGQAPAPFSVEDWAFILLPPTAFGAVWLLGRRLRVQGGARWQVLLSRAGGLMTLCGLVLTCLLVPIGIFGSMMDGIG